MLDTVKLRGLQWGNYVTDAERHHHLTKSAEAFADLADVTGLPDSAISLGGKLGLAIGARGKGTALAHYEPGTQVINLTRTKGVGSLAHEWAHAFDHSLTDYKSDKYASRNGVGRKPVDDAMAAVRRAMHESGFDDRLKAYVRDRIKNGTLAKNAEEYWNSPHEKFARSFERHVQAKLHADGRENTYLTGLHKETHPLWPNAAEIAKIGPAIDALMKVTRGE